MIINSLKELKQLYEEHNIEHYIELLDFEMIGDDSQFECAVVHTGISNYPHECYIYTKLYAYSIEHLSKVHEGHTVSFDCVVAIPRTPNKETNDESRI